MPTEVMLSGTITGSSEVKTSQKGTQYLASTIEAGREYKGEFRSCPIDFVCFGPTANQISRIIQPEVNFNLKGYLSIDERTTQAGKLIRNIKVIVNEFNIPMANANANQGPSEGLEFDNVKEAQAQTPPVTPETFEEDVPF